MLTMEPRHYKIVKDILSKYSYTFYAFGSRVHGNPKPLSDLDICFFENIPWNIRSHIDEDFEESDLPYKIDVVDWNTCSDEFRAQIKPDLVRIQGNKEIPESTHKS
jgi:predicted nucleotidyltransferase